MAPFVPELISDELNLVVALLIGICFGFVLEQAGFSSSRRLAGVFYGYDFTVLRVFFTAAVTAMSGVLLLGYAGLLDLDAIYVNPTWLLPAIVGGVVMGLGFLLGGYCPGTSLCAMAIGKIDAMFFVGGGLLGALLFGELYPLYEHFYESTFLGPVKVFDSLGISQGVFSFLLIVVAVLAFAVTTRIERRANRSSAPSLSFKPVHHILAGAGVIGLAILFLFLPDRKTHLIDKVSEPQYLLSHDVKRMEPDELAFRIIDHEPNIQIIDVRSADAFAKLPIPGSVNIPTRELFNKEWAASFSKRHVRKVIVGDSERDEHMAALLLRELGYDNVVLLSGGFDGFKETILSSASFIPTGTRWDADVKDFRQTARTEILRMIEENKHKKPVVRKIEKKIQGGC